LRVLIVDDNVDVVESLALMVEIWGHEVRSITDPQHAVATAIEYRPDAVLLDLAMPGLSGFEVAHRLRRHPTLARVLLVALTGFGREQDRHRTRAAGFDHHLLKPVEPEVLRQLLEPALPRTGVPAVEPTAPSPPRRAAG
jgi:CheY-like chemotaxis protein